MDENSVSMKENRSRKWQLTINNPAKTLFSHEYIKQILTGLSGVVYWCMADEVGEQGTYHTHLYICFADAVRFSSLKNKFPVAHFELANGTSLQNKEYVFKIGKWEKDKKGETNIRDTQEEYGECPIERQGQRNDITDLYDMIKEGLTNYQILETNPQYMMNVEKIDKARSIINQEKFKNTFRKLEVTYMYGLTETGKTRSIMEKHGYTNVFRVTDYLHPFDAYNGQDTIIFEEFRSSLKIQDMLNYLDGYPLELPARYNNKFACFTNVYIITNIKLKDQYPSILQEFPETYSAFIRRIHNVQIFHKKKMFDLEPKIDNYTINDYMSTIFDMPF